MVERMEEGIVIQCCGKGMGGFRFPVGFFNWFKTFFAFFLPRTVAFAIALLCFHHLAQSPISILFHSGMMPSGMMHSSMMHSGMMYSGMVRSGMMFRTVSFNIDSLMNDP